MYQIKLTLYFHKNQLFNRKFLQNYYPQALICLNINANKKFKMDRLNGHINKLLKILKNFKDFNNGIN